MNDENGSETRLASVAGALAEEPWLIRSLTVVLVANIVLSLVLLGVDLKQSATQAKNASERASEAQNRLLQATNALVELQTRHGHLLAEVAAAQNQLAHLRAESDAFNESYQSRKTELEAEFRTRRAAIDRENEKFESARRATADATTELRVIEGRLAEARTSQSQLVQDQAKLAVETQSSQEAVGRVRKELVEEGTRLEETRAAIQRAQLELDLELKRAQDLAQRQSAMRRESETIEGTLRNRRHERDTLEKEVERLQQQKRELDPVESR
ncbi:MAG: hypothetical protein U1G07_03955 [Verrucomicrobiota bacterium]